MERNACLFWSVADTLINKRKFTFIIPLDIIIIFLLKES